MSADITRLDLILRRRSTIGYATGMTLYTFVIVALYPSFKTDASLDSFTGSTAAALFGVTSSLTSPAGWLNGNIYANFFPLILLLLTIGYGAGALAGQDEDGTLCLLAVLPRRRRDLVAQKVLAMALQALFVAAAVAVVVIAGRSFELSLDAVRVVAVSVTSLLLALDFGLLALAVGAATGSRAVALAVGTTAAAVCYLISSLASVVHWIRPARYASPFYWAVGADQLSRGVTAVDYLVLVAIAAVAAGGAVRLFGRLDLH